MIDIDAAYTAARELRELLPAVQGLLRSTEQVPGPSSGTMRRREVFGPPPWHDLAAEVYFDVHAGLRHHETGLTIALFGHATFRPGTDAHTFASLTRLPILLDHAHAKSLDHEPVIIRAARDLTHWPVDARRVLGIPRDDERPWTKAPGDLRCPWCGNRLALAPGWDAHPESADVICRTCRDEHGRHYRWAPSLWTGLVLGGNEPVAAGNDEDDDGSELVTAAQAASRIDRLRAATVRQWAARGLVRAVGTARGGARLYRLEDLVARAGGTGTGHQ